MSKTTEAIIRYNDEHSIPTGDPIGWTPEPKRTEEERLRFTLGWLEESHDKYKILVAMSPTSAGPKRVAHREGMIAGLKFRLAELTTR